MESSSPTEFQRLILKMRLPLIWMGGAVLVLGGYKTYSFHRKEEQMYAFLQRHPAGFAQADDLRRAVGLHGEPIGWKLLAVGLALLLLGLFLHQIVVRPRK
jgi:hypothetical protein